MKKRLEAELISIAHRILKLKNKSEVDQLYKETQKLYETLTVLKFYQENFESVKDEVDTAVLEDKLEQHLQNETVQEVTTLDVPPAEEPAVEIQEEPQAPVATEEEAESISEEETEEDLGDSELAEQTIVSEETEEEVEPALESAAEEERIEIKNAPEEIAEQPVITPIFELSADDDEEEEEAAPVEDKQETKEKALEHFLGEDYVDPVFVKPNEVSLFSTEAPAETREEVRTALPTEETKATSLNTAFSKSIEIGLNDRVAFVNNLFGGSNEDFNRVLSQLNTFDTFEEAKTFLNEMVIPDYNYWVGKEEYIERFMDVVEKKFA